jgi:hypothetical protein
VTDAELAFVGVDRIRSGAGEGPNEWQIVEERGGVQRKLPHHAFPRRIPNPSTNDPWSVVIPLYRAGGTAPRL